MTMTTGPKVVCVFLALAVVSTADSPAGNSANAEAVREVLAGKRTAANAAWWGFNEEDSTESLQAAINSGARRVIVPNMKKDWVVRPIDLAGNQELIFEDGVVVTAKRGEYRAKSDTVLTAREISNLVIRGYGATIRMQKEDYISGDVLDRLHWNRWFGAYPKAEWRTALRLRHVTNVEVSGLTLRDSGGDGLYIDGDKQGYSKNIRIRDVVCDNNYRQGISIISVEGLTIENSVFKNTWGTPPAAGVDIEPDRPEERVRGIVFRNCRFEDNYGDGIEVNLARARAESGQASILFDHCRVSSRRGTGIRISKILDAGPEGLVEFRDCVVENTEGYGIKVQDKSAAAARVKFTRCVVRDTSKNRKYAGAWAPIWIDFRSPNTKRRGGIDFVDCSVEDNHDRVVLIAEESDGDYGLVDITGMIRAHNPFGVRTAIGKKQRGVTLAVKESGR